MSQDFTGTSSPSPTCPNCGAALPPSAPHDPVVTCNACGGTYPTGGYGYAMPISYPTKHASLKNPHSHHPHKKK